MTDPAPALVLLAHGSRHLDLGASLSRLVDAVDALARSQGEPLTVRAAYLDLAQPDLATLSGELAALGHRRVVCVPTLFTSAFHATVDVPDSARDAAAASGLELTVADILGTGDDVRDVLSAALDDADDRTDPADDVLLYSVGSSADEANEAVVDLGVRLAETRGCRVEVAFGTRAPRGTEVLAARLADGARVLVLPLFVSPGLLLDPMRRAVDERRAVGQSDAALLPPLETRLAPVVLARYQHATAGGRPVGNR